MEIRSRIEKQIVVAILMIAAALRLPGLDRAPPGLHHDEAQRGVDAWHLLSTGADRHGDPWPFFLECFGPGDYTAALSTYVMIPFVAALGRTPLAMRLPNALLGVATVLLLYGWLRRQCGTRTALLAAAILATDPWHVGLNRTAHESGYAPFFLAAAMLALHRAGLLPGPSSAQAASNEARPREDAAPESTTLAAASDPHEVAWSLLGGLMLGLHMWVYPATRLFTPLFVIAALAVYGRRYVRAAKLASGTRVILGVAAGLVIAAAPLWLTAMSHPEKLAARARATMHIHTGGTLANLLAELPLNWARNLDPRFLFLQADDMSRTLLPGIGQHLPVLSPFWVSGIVVVIIRARRDSFARLLLAWLVLYPIPAAICFDWNPHPMRTVGGMLLFPIIAAIGGAWLLERFQSRDRQGAVRSGVLATVAVAMVANLAYVARTYLIEFPGLAERAYQRTLGAAIRFAANELELDARFCVTNASSQAYIFAMAYEPVDRGGLRPLEYRFVTSGPFLFHQVVAWNRWVFLPSETKDHPDTVAAFATAVEELKTAGGGPIYAIVFACESIGGETVARFESLDGPDPTRDCEIRRFEWTVAAGATSGRLGPPTRLAGLKLH